MNLDQPTFENLQFIMKDLAGRLNVVNRALLDPEDYDLDKYADLKFMHEVIVQKGHLSPAETQAFIEELRKTRKK